MSRQPEPKAFPKKFLWGASSSAHQVEGNNHNQWSVWELENAKSLAKQAEYHYHDLPSWPLVKADASNATSYIAAAASDHYNRYENDFDILTKLHMNTFRFSVEWSRIEPEEGAWSAEAIEHYRQYVAALKARDIEPIVTLFHFTLPVWFSELGGFEHKKNIHYFTRFAEKIISELGINVRYVITINEPEIYAYESYLQGSWPPGVQSKKTMLIVINNLALAHKRAAQAIRSLNRRYKISIAKNSYYYYAGDDALLSRKTADIMQYSQDDYFLKKVAKDCDFLGVNYYFSHRIYGYRVHNPEDALSDLGWSLDPASLQHLLERLHDKYQLPIIVTANGLADATDQRRKWWLTQTIIAMQKAMTYGVKLEGYLHASLLDGFEWDKGSWPRFGLIAVDYSTQKRTARSSAVWLSKTIKRLRGI